MTETKTITNSSWIKGASFDNGNLTLDLANGRKATLTGVPESEYRNLVGAGSPGQYFNTHLKDKYATR